MMNRREFAKGGLAALGFLALDGLPVFAAPAGWTPKKKPNLVLGVMSDSHLRVGYDAVTPGRAFPLKYVQNAFRLFKSRSIDAFVHCGDAAHRGCVREWEFHKELLDDVFGKRGGPARIVIVGNHELFEYAKVWWPDNWQDRQINHDLAKNYERIWGLPYEDVQHWEIKGYHFFGRHWQTQEAALADFINANAGKYALAGEKPFFILSHARNHFACNHALREFPNAIAFFGHWHQSNADWKSIYYDSFGGFFPSIEVGACRFDGGNTLDANESVLKEKFAASDKKPEEKEQDWHSNKVPSRQAMVVNIYDDFVMFERHEVGQGGKLGPDWVLPLKWREKKDANGEPFKHPFSRDMLARRIGTPEFPAKAKLEIGRIGDSLKLKIPLADGNEKSRVFAYDVVVIGDDPQKKFFKSAYFEGVNLGIGHEPDGGITKVELPMAELPAGKNLTIAVRPISSLGTKGKAIATKFQGVSHSAIQQKRKERNT